MKLELNIGERVGAINILNAFKGNLDTMASLIEDIRKFVISEEDWEAVGKTEERSGEQIIIRWDESKDTGKEIEIGVETAKYLSDEIKKKSDAGELTFQDKALVTLSSKLK